MERIRHRDRLVKPQLRDDDPSCSDNASCHDRQPKRRLSRREVLLWVMEVSARGESCAVTVSLPGDLIPSI